MHIIIILTLQEIIYTYMYLYKTALEIRGHIFGKKNYLLVFSMYNTKINQGIGIIILIFFFSQLFLV